MTISPEVAIRIHSLVRAYRAWAKGIAETDDWLTACALNDLKQAADNFQTVCPHCGTAMITMQDHRVYAAEIYTSHYCPSCSTTVTILTPAHGQ